MIFIDYGYNVLKSPLKSFHKDILPAYKDLRKKVTKAFEEMETAETKYLAVKKSAVC